MEILNQYQNVLDAIDHSKLIKDYQEAKEKVLQDESLQQLIEKYHQTKDTKLQQKIYQNEAYQAFKQQETNLNILIIQLNFLLKELKGKKA